ncbi:GntR family transcriptional regulator [Enterococcus sp. JM4C]|uniref:GntR family transcriptional regulator n=1 Tax=Candidatus Enterococcus huntleyi TaxID=1857217 RepID=UPI00137A5D98|nr:LacI family DNA-binding transcriptional regulator [Enterococcus sp. JM4C]KAF1296662.1 GntR family transcriptional regulator [Enterococcus sp. JM4C]
MSQPLYKKIMSDLQQAIQTGELAIDSQLPTEKELSETYGVSRITSKRALTELEQAGLIYRIQGRGSFVKEPVHTPKTTASRILFLLPFVNDLSVGNFTEGLNPVMSEKNIEVMMASLFFLSGKTAKEIAAEFDGMIYYAHSTEQYLDILFELSLLQFPVIILDKKIYDLPFPTVLSDNFEGGSLATTRLIDDGHKRIAYLFGGEIHPQSARQRYLGYIDSLSKANLDFHTQLDELLLIDSNLSIYLETNEITGLVCENDLVAIQAMRVLRQAGKEVPASFSVIGFDDIQAAALVDPPLTTIAQDFKKLGEIAGTLLLEWIESGTRPSDQKVPVRYIKRQSTKEI